MAKRSFTGRRVSVRKKATVWTTNLQTNDIGPTVETISFPIAVATDWERSAGSLERATILAVKGTIMIYPKDTSPAVGQNRIVGLFSVQDEDAPAIDPAAQSTHDDEASMFSFVYENHKANGVLDNSWADVAHVRIPVDIKVKRKMTSGQQLEVSLAFGVVTGTGSVYRVGWLLRTLIAVGA